MKKSTSLLFLAFTTLSASAQSLQDAIKLTDKEQFEKATSAFKTLLATDPQNGEAWFYLGENYWANERTDSAALCYDRGMGISKFPLNHAGAGKVLWVQGKTAEAQAKFDQAIAIACDKANKFSKPQQANAYREVAEALAEGPNKNHAKALEFIAKAIEFDPKNAEVFILKGDVLFDQNPTDGGTPLENGYKPAINLDITNAKPVARKAFMYYRGNNFQASVDEYTKAIGIDPLFAPAYSGRAEAYFKLRDFEKATADMNKYLELNTGNQSARVRNAQFLFLVGKNQESLTEINALESQGVQNIVLKRLKAYNQMELKDAAGAKATLEAYFAEQKPEKIVFSDYEYMGKALSALGNDSLAGENLLKAARMDRTKGSTLFSDAAKAFNKAKLNTRAVETMREKIALGKPETNDYYFLGDAANKGKQWSTADSAWTKYIEMNPNAYQGYKFRARALTGLDSTTTKTFAGKEMYATMLTKMKPEEQEKYKTDVEEALNYLGVAAWLNKEAQDLPKAKCYFEKVKALNAGTSITKEVVEKYLLSKDLKDIAPGTCD